MASITSKEKTYVNVLVSNYTNKYITFNKGEYVRHLKPVIAARADSYLPSHAQPDTHSTNSVTTQPIMAEQVKPDTLHPPCHKLKPIIESKLDTLLKDYSSQFAKDETSIRTTPLTEMMIDTGISEPVSQNHTQLPWKITNG